jgi:succinate dehydrogenase hydrophobic anchor subunit
MTHRNYCTISGLLFLLVALAHLLRIMNGMSVQIDDYSVPMLVSWVGLIVPAVLAIWAFRLASQ